MIVYYYPILRVECAQESSPMTK